MSHKTSAVRDAKMEHIHTAFALKSTHVRNMFKVLMSLNFPFCLFGKVTVLASFKGKRQRVLKIFSFLAC